MEVISSEFTKRKTNKGKHTNPLPEELKEDAADYALMNKRAPVESRCDDKHVLQQLERYATDPTYNLINMAEFFSVSQSSLSKLLSSEKYKEIASEAKIARSHMLVQDGLNVLRSTHSRISAGEETHPSLLKASSELAKYEMQYACLLNPEFSGRGKGNGDTNIQINLQTPVDVKEL